MNKVKKVIAGILALNMLIAVPVFAEVPKGTVVIGGKAYNLSYANKAVNNKEILSVIQNNEYGTIFIKGTNGKWYDNNTGNEIDRNLIPSVIYKDAEGNRTAYAAEDGDEISLEDFAFRVENAGFISKNQVRIKFSHLLKDSSIKSFIKIAGKELNEEDKITILDDGYTAIIDLAVGINEGNTETSISVSKDVQAFDGETLFKEFKRDILVLNSKDKVFSSEDEINSDVNILSEGLTFEKTKVNGSITVYADNITLSNVSGKNIIISSGSQKSIELDGEFNDDIILEGSAKLKASKESVIKNVIIRSKDNKAEITLDGIFEQVSVESAIGAIHMAKNAEIGTLVINEEVDVQGDSSNRICEVSSENSDLKASTYGEIKNGGQLSNTNTPVIVAPIRPSTPDPTEIVQRFNEGKLSVELRRSYKFINGKSVVNLKATLASGVSSLYNSTITIYDNEGKVVYQGEAAFENNKALFSETRLAKGNYKMVVNPGLLGDKHTFKFIIK